MDRAPGDAARARGWRWHRSCVSWRALRCPRGAHTFRATSTSKETAMQWETPTFTDLRFGFEITMYIANR
ncbi:pyrroloquinoline quinone precursor peptide PqqA [Melaminivora suipulveris]|uniref:Coenzyme PQQ synthesis protein A n=1 Tax=Melaminivora suipulveris TaxID=2109913 RepID=A0A2R3QH45_9BURK|nr:pyrroloquinoline quinone precursor peptide PqqA [Melaminivora suipulveris]